jgi:PRC-barrel domain
MTSPQQWDSMIGATAVDTDGDKIGKVGQVYLNDETGEPEWVTITTGLFGTPESFAPLHNARSGDGELRLAVTKQQVDDAPNIDADNHLTIFNSGGYRVWPSGG